MGISRAAVLLGWVVLTTVAALPVETLAASRPIPEGVQRRLAAKVLRLASQPKSAAVDGQIFASGFEDGETPVCQPGVDSNGDGLLDLQCVQQFVPPNPEDIAPPPTPGGIDPYIDLYDFLYDSPTPVQIGVGEGVISDHRIAVLRGRVLDEDGQPLPSVLVRVLDGLDYGYTYSRADGQYDLAVNGGGTIVLDFQRAGYIRAQRSSTGVEWQSFAHVDDVTLLPYDPNVTTVVFARSAPKQIVRGSTVIDAAGQRQGVLVIPAGTIATVYSDQGVFDPPSLDLRITEYTVGNNALSRMPAQLPPTSGYTYAMELSADQAEAAGNPYISFNVPEGATAAPAYYIENFMGYPVGEAVPLGAYDHWTGAWVPEDDGRVIKLLSESGGIASIDVMGAGNPATQTELDALGVTVEELRTLSTLYDTGDELWRVLIKHLTPYDCNSPRKPPDDAIPPPATEDDEEKEEDEDEEECGSVIGCGNRTLSEVIPINGSTGALEVSTLRSTGRTRRSFQLRASIAPAPAVQSLKRIDVTYEVAGKRETRSLSPSVPVEDSFTWDGSDIYGRQIQGKVLAKRRVSYVYDAIPVTAAEFVQSFAALSGTGAEISGNAQRTEYLLSRVQSTKLGVSVGLQASPAAGALVAGVNHYDAHMGIVSDGSGARRQSNTSQRVNHLIGAPDRYDYAWEILEGALARNTQATVISDAVNVPNGDPVVANHNPAAAWRIDHEGRFRKVIEFPTGVLESIALHPQTKQLYFAVDDDEGVRIVRTELDGSQPATIWTAICAAGVTYCPIASIAFDATGFLYAGVENRISAQRWTAIWQIDPNDPPSARHVAGTRKAISLDGPSVPSTSVWINHGTRLAPTSDGGLAWLDWGDVDPSPSIQSYGYKIRRLGTDGVVRVFTPGGPLCTPVSDYCVLTAAGFITTAAPAPLAKDAFAVQALGFTQLRNGAFLFADYSFQAIWQVDVEGGLTRFAGDHGLSDCDPSSPPIPEPDRCMTGASSLRVKEAAYGVLRELDDGSILSFAWTVNAMHAIRPPLRAKSFGPPAIPSRGGGRLESFDPAGRQLGANSTLTGAVVSTMTYDANGRLASVSDGYGNVTTYQRHPTTGALEAIENPYGLVTTIATDTQGRITRVTRPDGKWTEITYDDEGLVDTYTNPRGKTSVMSYDAHGDLISDYNATGGGWDLSEVRSGGARHVSLTSGMGRTKTHVIDRNDDAGIYSKTSTFPDGTSSTLIRRDDGSRELTTRDGTLVKTLQKTDPRFGAFGGAADVSARLPSGLTKTIVRDKSVVLSNPDDPLSLTSMTTTSKMNGRVYSSTYTQVDRRFATSTPTGRTAEILVDPQEQPTSISVPGLSPISIGYDEDGRVNSVTSGSRSTTLTYDPNGWMDSFVDPLGQTVDLENDLLGRPTSITLPGNRVLGFGYDENGNVTTVTPPGRSAHSFTYDDADLLASYLAPAVAGGGSNTTSYFWNADNQLESITRPDNLVIDTVYGTTDGRIESIQTPSGTYSYSYAGAQVASIAAPGSVALAYHWDGALLTQQTLSGPVNGVVGYGWDANFWLSSVSVAGQTLTYGYDNDGLMTSATIGLAAMTLTRNAQNGLISDTALGVIGDHWTFNGHAEPAGYEVRIGLNPPFFTHGFVRDDLGKITERSRAEPSVAAIETYSYDAAGRLDTFSRDNQLASDYAFDLNSNRTSAVYHPNHPLWNKTLPCIGALSGTDPITISGSYDAQDRMTSYGSCTFTYTANGELTSRSDSATSQTTTYQYDVFGNLRSATLPDGTQVDYVIDGQNRRVGKKRNGVLEQGFLYLNQLEPVAEFDSNGALVSTFVYADRPHVPSFMIKGTTVYRIISDHLGSVRLVVATSDGAIVQRMDYDEYGNVVEDTNPGFQPFGYVGSLYDRDTGLVRHGSRDYDPSSGRWTSKDAKKYLSRQSNPYCYANGDPTNRIDVDGEYALPIILAGALALGVGIWSYFEWVDHFDQSAEHSRSAVENFKSAKELRDLLQKCIENTCTEEEAKFCPYVEDAIWEAEQNGFKDMSGIADELGEAAYKDHPLFPGPKGPIKKLIFDESKDH